jgi:hypothetical protein
MIIFENKGMLDINAVREGLKDETYALQTYLFNKIISMGEDMLGEPL